jgi:hypothetical protein
MDQALDLSVPKIVALFRFSGKCLVCKAAGDFLSECDTTQTLNLRESFIESRGEGVRITTWLFRLA